jgi:hypothetical protein
MKMTNFKIATVVKLTMAHGRIRRVLVEMIQIGCTMHEILFHGI